MQFRYHDNYCGPQYTGGRFVAEGEPGNYDVPALSCLDIACQKHDKFYEEHRFRTGDLQFVADAIRCGMLNPLSAPKALPAALLMAAKAILSQDVTPVFTKPDVQRIYREGGKNYAKNVHHFRGPHNERYDQIVPVRLIDETKYVTGAHVGVPNLLHAHLADFAKRVPPQLPLVGIEPNPGPPVRGKSGIKKAPKQRKRVVKKLNQIIRAEKRAPRMFAPVAYNVSTNFRPRTNMIRERGKIMLGSVSSLTGTAGAELYKLDCTPSELGGMLSRMAELHERYRVHNFSIEWVPSVANNFAGQILIVYHYDPATWGQVYNNVSVIDNSNARVAIAFPPREPRTVGVPFKDDSFKWRYCFPEINEPRTSSPGYFTVISTAAMTASTDIGSLVLHYDIEFTDRIIRPIQLQFLRLHDHAGAHAISTAIIKPSADVSVAGDLTWQQFADTTKDGYFKLPPWTHWDINLTAHYTSVTTLSFSDTWQNVNHSVAAGATWADVPAGTTYRAVYSNTIWTGGDVGYFKFGFGGSGTPNEITITLGQLPYDIVFPPLPALSLDGEDEKESDTIVVTTEPPSNKSRPALRLK